MGPSPTAQPLPSARTGFVPPVSKTHIVMPVRLHAWMSGDMGRSLQNTLVDELGELPNLKVTRLPKAFVIEAEEEPGPFLETAYRAAHKLESRVQRAYPVLHHEMGPVWTGTMQAVFDAFEDAASKVPGDA